jgi:Uma2 family endonuclease
MATVTRPRSIGDLIKNLGGISPSRICYTPSPGTATVKDLIRVNRQQTGIYELVEGTLVEKFMGCVEGFLAAEIIFLLLEFVKPRRLGFVGGPDATMRILPGIVRAADVSFVSRDKFPNGKITRDPVPDLVPDLAIELISKGDRPGEIKKKRREYFRSGVRAVWEIDQRTETAAVYTAPDEVTHIPRGGVIDGGDVLPGFQLHLAELFADLDDLPENHAKKPARNGKKK